MMIYPHKPWTFLVYIAGDNNLDPSARFDLQEMKWGARGENVHVVAQFDSREDLTYRYRFANRTQEQLGDPLPDVNSGDPATLTDFVEWGRTHFPSERTALVVWSHGTGLRNLPADFDYSSLRSTEIEQTKEELRRTLFRSSLAGLAQRRRRLRGIAIDATARDFLDTRELAQALTDARGEKPILDLLGFDACLMNVLEIAYQLRHEARCIVGSQEQMPGSGWRYDDILTLLEEDPTLDGPSLARWIVDIFLLSVGGLRRQEAKFTQSALDLSAISETCDLIGQVVTGLVDGGALGHGKVAQALAVINREVKRFHDRDLVDLGDWCALLNRNTKGPAGRPFRAALDALQTHLQPGGGLVLASKAHAGEDLAQVHGVSVYWPRQEYDPLYDELDFVHTGWNRLIQKTLGRGL